jgi:hypothetical protein
MANRASGKRKRLQEILLSIRDISPLRRSDKSEEITEGEISRLPQLPPVPPQAIEPEVPATQDTIILAEQRDKESVQKYFVDIYDSSKGVYASADDLRRLREEIGAKVRDLAARITVDKAELKLWVAWLNVHDTMLR